jgi:putative transposase
VEKTVIHKAFRYRIYPTSDHQIALAVEFGHARFVYNYFLALRQAHYQQTGEGLSYKACSKRLKALKRDGEHDWLRDADSQVLQQKLMDLQRAYDNFFAGRTKYPVFKKKRYRQAVRFPQRFELNADAKTIFLPKVGSVPVVLHRPYEGAIKSVTVTKTSGGAYCVSLLCAVEIDERQPNGQPHAAIDLGLMHFATLSTGEKVEHPKWIRQSEKKLQRLQRKQARQVPGSNRWEETRLKLARQHEKVANQRADFQHKLSYHLVHNFGSIHVENLNIARMVRNHSLAKAISDSGWGRFGEMLVYKGEWYGCTVEKVDRFFPSSKTCHKCQHIKQDLKLSDRFWTCPKCHSEHDRDINAALNLKNYQPKRKLGRGLVRSHAGGDCVRPDTHSGDAARERAAVVEPGSPTPFRVG